MAKQIKTIKQVMNFITAYYFNIAKPIFIKFDRELIVLVNSTNPLLQKILLEAIDEQFIPLSISQKFNEYENKVCYQIKFAASQV